MKNGLLKPRSEGASRTWLGRRGRIVAMVLTAVAGLAVGASITAVHRSKSFEERTVSELMGNLRKPDSVFDNALQKFWTLLPRAVAMRFDHLRPLRAVDVRRFAAIELKRRAPAGVEAVPALVRALEDRDKGVREFTLQALTAFGPPAAPALPRVMALLRDGVSSNHVLRAEAVRAVGAIASDDPAVVALLLEMVRTGEMPGTAEGGRAGPSSAMRLAALRTLEKLARPGDAVFPALLELLPGAEPAFATELIWVMTRLRPDSPQLVPVLLTELQRAPDPGIGGTVRGTARVDRAETREAALRALQGLARTNDRAAEGLIAALGKVEREWRLQVIQALARVRPARPAAVTAVAAFLRNEDRELRDGAITALGVVGAPAAEAVPVLMELLGRELAALPKRAVSAPEPPRRPAELTPVSRWATDGQRVFAISPAMVRRGFEAIGATMIETLGRIGPEARPALPLLAEALRSAEPEFRLAAGMALWRIDRQAGPMIDVVTTVLEESPEFVGGRFRAREAFRELGVEGVPLLRSALRHRETGVRMEALSALRELGPRATAAVPDLEALAGSTDPMRDFATHVLRVVRWTNAIPGGGPAQIRGRKL